MDIEYLLRCVPQFRAGLMRLLRPSEITTVMIMLNCKMTKVEMMTYLKPHRELTNYSGWIETMVSKKYPVVLVGRDLPRLINKIAHPFTSGEVNTDAEPINVMVLCVGRSIRTWSIMNTNANTHGAQNTSRSIYDNAKMILPEHVTKDASDATDTSVVRGRPKDFTVYEYTDNNVHVLFNRRVDGCVTPHLTVVTELSVDECTDIITYPPSASITEPDTSEYATAYIDVNSDPYSHQCVNVSVIDTDDRLMHTVTLLENDQIEDRYRFQLRVPKNIAWSIGKVCAFEIETSIMNTDSDIVTSPNSFYFDDCECNSCTNLARFRNAMLGIT